MKKYFCFFFLKKQKIIVRGGARSRLGIGANCILLSVATRKMYFPMQTTLDFEHDAVASNYSSGWYSAC